MQQVEYVVEQRVSIQVGEEQDVIVGKQEEVVYQQKTKRRVVGVVEYLNLHILDIKKLTSEPHPWQWYHFRLLFFYCID